MQQVCDGISHCEDGKDEDESACEKKNRLCIKEPYNGACGEHFCLYIQQDIQQVLVDIAAA